MSESIAVREQNRELAERINREARENPDSPYAGKFVGITGGQVVVVADTLREVSQHLRQIEPDPAKCYCIEVSADYDKVCEVWGLSSIACFRFLNQFHYGNFANPDSFGLALLSEVR